MKIKIYSLAIAALAATTFSPASQSAELCTNFGPQTPRDIASLAGKNPQQFAIARPAKQLNLCNIHFHTNAEHKGPGFSVSAGSGKFGGYKCNGTSKLTPAELKAPKDKVCKGLKPGDTVEFHWVHSSCSVTPGKGLGSCLSDSCANPELRVETQVFLLVNDAKADNFAKYTYGGNKVNGLHQAKAIPGGSGKPVVFRGSTTGPKYTQSTCSPLQVTWSVRPQCTKLDINSLASWCASGNVFKEDHAHGVRQLVTAPELLSEIN